jgi:hypothetical protein
MDKLAMVKSAEVRGVMACLVDNGLLKVANEEMFEMMADAVVEKLAEDYNLEDVLDNTAEVAEAAEAIENMDEEELAELVAAADTDDEVVEDDVVEDDIDKEASAADIDGVMQDYSKLLMAKEAGEITEQYFEKEAGAIKEFLSKMYAGAKAAPGKMYAGAKAAPGKMYAGAKAAPGKMYAGAKAAPGKVKNIAKEVPGKTIDGLTFDRLRAAMRSNGSKDFKKKLVMQGLRQSGGAYAGLGAAGYGGKKVYDRVTD